MYCAIVSKTLCGSPILRDSDASSDSLNRPGMMYVSDLKADSIWETELAFCDTKFSYILTSLCWENCDCCDCVWIRVASGIIVFEAMVVLCPFQHLNRDGGWCEMR